MKTATYAQHAGSSGLAKLFHGVQSVFFAIALLMAADFAFGLPFWAARAMSDRWGSLFFALILPAIAISFAISIIAPGTQVGRKFRICLIWMEGRWPVISWFSPGESP